MLRRVIQDISFSTIVALVALGIAILACFIYYFDTVYGNTVREFITKNRAKKKSLQ